MIKIKESPDYGGAYDIDPRQYFTKDDLLELGECVCEHLNNCYPMTEFQISDINIDENNYLYLEVETYDEEYGASAEFTIDMRKIKKPSDLKDKYWSVFVKSLRESLEDYFISEYDDLGIDTRTGEEFGYYN